MGADQAGDHLRSRPRTAGGTRRPRAPPGSGAGTAARRRRSWTRWQRSPRRSAPRRAPPPGRAGRRRPRASPPGSAPPAPATWAAANALTASGAAVLGDPAQRGGGEAVVGVREALAGRRRSARTILAGRPRPRGPRLRALAGLDQAVGEHRVEVLADRRRAEPELRAQLGRGGRAALEQQLGDPVPGAPVRRGGDRPPRPLRDSTSFFTTPTLRNSAAHLQTGAPVIHDTGRARAAHESRSNCARTMPGVNVLPVCSAPAAPLASLIANVGIVVTGAAVRLTGSGLGCPTWPRCTDDSYTTTAEMGIHGAIEFGNRLLTFVAGRDRAGRASWRRCWQQPRRRSLVLLVARGRPRHPRRRAWSAASPC